MCQILKGYIMLGIIFGSYKLGEFGETLIGSFYYKDNVKFMF